MAKKPQPKPEPAKPSFSVRLDADERAALNAAAEKDDRRPAYLARIYIREGLKRAGFLK